MPTTGIDNSTGQLASPALDWIGARGELASIDAHGDWDREAYAQLERHVETVLDGTAKVAMLTLNAQQAAWPCLAAHRCTVALRRLSRQKPTWAFIDGDALGYSYAMAASCSGIFVRADSRLGLFGGCDEDATVLFEIAVRDSRPQVTAEAFAECQHRIVSGKAAESRSRRLADAVCNSPERLLADLFYTKSRGLMLTPIN